MNHHRKVIRHGEDKKNQFQPGATAISGMDEGLLCAVEKDPDRTFIPENCASKKRTTRFLRDRKKKVVETALTLR